MKKGIPAAISVLCLTMLFLAGFFCACPAPVALAEASVAGPDQIILTWTEDPAAAQTVTWLMSEDITAQLQYLQKERFTGNFDSASTIQVQGDPFDSTHYRYQADISGLTPDTSYAYRVGSEGAWSETLSFTTAKDTDNFSFLYMGDIQSGYAEWDMMVDSVYKAYPQIKFSLLGGDITDDGNDPNEWRQFLNAAAGVFSRIPLMPTLGNHDGEMYLKFFALPANGPAGLKQEFYSFDYGNAHFVVLNSNNNTDEAAKQWLQADLQNTTKTWKFVMFHHPSYPVFDDYKTIDDSIRENWVPIMENNGVDMVFVGHQHAYMRTYPIYQGEIRSDPDAYGIVYVMGNAGSKAYGIGSGFSYIALEESGSNYQVIDIDGDVLTMTSKKATGELIESYRIDKRETAFPVYKVSFKDDPSYASAATQDGSITMTVNSGNAGFRYFTVNVALGVSHEGNEAVIFTHLRNGIQLGINAGKADFDLATAAQAGFNVVPGDIIKVYIVDDLTNATNRNPTIFQ